MKELRDVINDRQDVLEMYSIKRVYAFKMYLMLYDVHLAFHGSNTKYLSSEYPPEVYPQKVDERDEWSICVLDTIIEELVDLTK